MGHKENRIDNDGIIIINLITYKQSAVGNAQAEAIRRLKIQRILSILKTWIRRT